MYDNNYSNWVLAFILIGMTLGGWKIMEIGIWLFKHIHISVG
jgi:phage-related tail fiber protein